MNKTGVFFTTVVSMLALAAGLLILQQDHVDSPDPTAQQLAEAAASVDHEPVPLPMLPPVQRAQARLQPADRILADEHSWQGDNRVRRQYLIHAPHLSGLHLLYQEYWCLAQPQQPRLTHQHWQVAEQLLLRVDHAATAGPALAAAMPELELHPLDGRHSLLARFPVHSPTCHQQWQQRLEQHPLVRSSEADVLAWLSNEEDVIPNDPLFSQQWALRNEGQVTGGRSGADISATRAWAISTGSEDVVVAIIDTGVYFEHEDLGANIWSNPHEEANESDDSGNGKVDDIRGWNFADDTNDVSDVDGHGTHIAGIIAAHTDNLSGIAGVSWQSRLMPLKVGEGTSFPVSRAVQAIVYADEHGAQLINMSWATGADSSTLRNAIANRPHILFAAAAGNDGEDIDSKPVFPAAYRFDHLVAVTATTASDTLPSFANTGQNRVHLGAPGGSILSTWIEDEDAQVPYAFSSGTSMAVPHVLGVAALLLAEDATRSPYDLRSIMMLSGDPLSQLYDTTISGRRLNAHAALLRLADWPAQPRRIGGLRAWQDGKLRSTSIQVEQGGSLHYDAKTTIHDIGGLRPDLNIDITFPLEADG